MNAFDFDNTIYDGESAIDLFWFCIREDKKMRRHIPLVIADLVLYKLGLAGIDKVCRDIETVCQAIVRNRDRFEEKVAEFWEINGCKLKKQFLDMIQPDDIIITASPQFIIDGIRDKLNTRNVVSSVVNINNGKVEFLCYRDNKVKRFNELYGGRIDRFYTDSKNDLPLIAISDKAFLVKNNRIKQIK